MKHQQGKFSVIQNLELYYQSWHPNENVRGIVVFIHGLGGHSGVFDNLVEFLVARNFSVYGFDLRGHGRSPGQRGYINNWSEFREDVQAFLHFVRIQECDRPLFLLGQSLGGTIALDYALRYPSGLQGLVVLSPALGVNISPLKLIIGRIFSRFFPRFTLDTGIDLTTGSRDPQVVAGYAADTLRHTQGTARLATEFFNTVTWIETHARDLQVPLLILHGQADRVTLVENSRLFFERVTLADKEIKEYPDSYHELHNDLNYQEVLADIGSWLERHLNIKRIEH
ncbi:MAG: monoacylglycerol lipase [Pleurocapsa sp.]